MTMITRVNNVIYECNKTGRKECKMLKEYILENMENARITAWSFPAAPAVTVPFYSPKMITFPFAVTRAPCSTSPMITMLCSLSRTCPDRSVPR